MVNAILFIMEEQMKFFEKIPFPFRLTNFRKSESEPIDAEKNKEIITVPENRQFNFQRLNSTGRLWNPDVNSSLSRPRDLFPVSSNIVHFDTEESQRSIKKPSFIHGGTRYFAGATDNGFLSPRNDTSFNLGLPTGKQGYSPQAFRDEIHAEREEKATAVPPKIVSMQQPDGEIIAPSRSEAFGTYAAGALGGNIGEERTMFGPHGNWGEDGLGPEPDGYMPGDTPPTRAEILARILQKEYEKRAMAKLSQEEEGSVIDNSGVPLSDLARTAEFYAQKYADNPKHSRWKLREMMQLPEDRSEQASWHAQVTRTPTDDSGKPYDLGDKKDGITYAQDIADMIEAHLRATGKWPQQRTNDIVENYSPENGVSRNFLLQQEARLREDSAPDLSDFDVVPQDSSITEPESSIAPEFSPEHLNSLSMEEMEDLINGMGQPVVPQDSSITEPESSIAPEFSPEHLNSLSMQEMEDLINGMGESNSDNDSENIMMTPTNDFPPEEEGETWVYDDDGNPVKIYESE